MHRARLVALAAVVAVVTLTVGVVSTVAQETSPATRHRVAGSLRLSADVAPPRSTVRAHGRVATQARRRVVLQRSVAGSWVTAAVGRSSRRGRYELVTQLPDTQAAVVRYRVFMPRCTVGGRRLPRRFTPTDSVRIEAPSPTPTALPTPTPTSPPPTPGIGPGVIAYWAMDEPGGATTMVDSTTYGHHGTISTDAATAGLRLTGGAYEWAMRCRDCPPTALARVVQVPDSDDLEIADPAVDWTLEFRFRTTQGYGNLMQKGQATTAGGQIKVEDPAGLRCVFTGANGRHAVARATRPLNDGEWHTVACVHTATSVSQWVDGVLVAEVAVDTGPIANTFPFVIGGKTQCDQRTVGCDYYRGVIDWARIVHG